MKSSFRHRRLSGTPVAIGLALSLSAVWAGEAWAQG